MGGKGKRYTTSADKRDRGKAYTLAEAIELVAGGSGTSFDETVDLAMKLNVDPRHADQNVRGTVALPHGTGREPGVSGNLLTTALPESGWSTENAVSNFEAVEGPVTRKSLVKRKYRRAKRKDVEKATKL